MRARTAAAGGQHGVLEVRVEAAVGGHCRPAVVPQHARSAPYRQRRLCVQYRVSKILLLSRFEL